MGDRNTKFFHTCATERRKKNLIRRVVMESKGICDNVEDIADIFKFYFSILFTTSGHSLDNIQQYIQTIELKVTDAMNLRITRAYSRQEVELAFKQMSPLKSPSPNGFGTRFY